MNTHLQLDSQHYKCKSCLKLHVGPTRTLEFQCIRENPTEKGMEQIYQAEFSEPCACDDRLVITFFVRKSPAGFFNYHGCHSTNAYLLSPPNVREHEDIVDE